jgi:glycogen operon protein
MLAGGSEFYRTQFGNNNPFNMDTVANWFDWQAAQQQSAVTSFTRNLVWFRRSHVCLRPSQFFTGTDHNCNGLKDLAWYFDSGAEVSAEYFANPSNRFLAFRIDGTEFGDSVTSIYVAYNGWTDPINVAIPLLIAGNAWYVVADTSAASEPWGNIHAAGQEAVLSGGHYLVSGRSLVVLLER